MKARAIPTLTLVLVAVSLAACGSSSSPSSSSSSTAGGASTSAAGGGSTSTGGAGTDSTTGAGASTQPANGQIGPEGIPLELGAALAPASTTVAGATVDGVQCAPIEQLAYHIHAHLQVFVDGQPRQLPAAIGLIGAVGERTPRGPFYGAQGCYYWLHTHTTDGVIHVESPTPRIYTVGNFFDEWHQPLSANQVASATGKVAAFVNGKPWTQDVRAIPLNPHAVIQLDVGSPTVPAVAISWAGTQL